MKVLKNLFLTVTVFVFLLNFISTPVLAQPNQSNFQQIQQQQAQKQLQQDQYARQLIDLARLVSATLANIYQSYVRELNEQDVKNIERILTLALNQILKELDPHSYLIPPQNIEAEKKMIKGSYVGLGIMVRIADEESYWDTALKLIEKEKPNLTEREVRFILSILNRFDFNDPEKYYKKSLLFVVLKKIKTPEAEELRYKLEKGIVGPHGIEITEVFPGGPADKAGLKKGCRITEVGGISLNGLELGKILREYILGPAGSQVQLTVKKPDNQIEKIVVTRESVKPPMVKSKMLAGDIGYIQLKGFESQWSGEQMKKALIELKKKGMKKLVLDLRDNSGGLLSEADEILGMLLPPALLEYCLERRGRYGAGGATTLRPPQIFKGPLVVLVNGNSASASEIVSGAIQDHKRGALIGTKTFGKGTAQQNIPMPAGYALHLTIWHWFTPLDRNVNKIGLEPDVKIEDNPATPQDEVIEKAIEILSHPSVYYGILKSN